MVTLANLIVRIIPKGFKKTKASLDSLGTSVKKFGVLAKASFAIAGLAVVVFIRDLFKLRTQMRFTRKSFIQLTGGVEAFADSLLVDLKKATNSMVSDLDAMQAANTAMLLGIDENKLPDLFRISAVLAKASGRTVTEAINDITTGIGRQSRLILDNLGIIVDSTSAQERFADSLNKTVNELTESEKKLAFLNEAIRIGGGNVDKLGGELEGMVDPSQKLSAAWNDFKASLSEITQVLTPLFTGLSNLLSSMTEVRTETKRLQDAQKEIRDSGFKFLINALDEVEKKFKFRGNIKIYRSEIFKLKQELDSLRLESELLVSTFNNVGEGFSSINDLMSPLIDSFKTLDLTAEDQVKNFKKLNRELMFQQKLLDATSEKEKQLIRLKEEDAEFTIFLTEQIELKNISVKQANILDEQQNQLFRDKISLAQGLVNELSRLNNFEGGLGDFTGRGGTLFGQSRRDRDVNIAKFSRSVQPSGVRTFTAVEQDYQASRARRSG